jgi:apolipoprotein N-acyltransferase
METASGNNLIGLVAWRRQAWRLAAALLGGLALALAFPPLEWGWLAWLGLVPMLMVPAPATRWRRFGLGYCFGLAFWMPALWWLNTIGFAAGVLLSFYCALWPALWYLLVVELAAGRGGFVPVAAVRQRSLWRQWGWTVAVAALWVLTEHGRSYLFTGFSWNQLAISQWSNRSLVALTSVTGVYGVSFLLAFFNASVAVYLWPEQGTIENGKLKMENGEGTIENGQLKMENGEGKRDNEKMAGGAWQSIPAGVRRRLFLVPVVVLLVVCTLAGFRLFRQANLNEPDQRFTALTVQGNIPQCRQFTMEDLDFALGTYLRLTKEALQGRGADLVVWPESAVPAPLGYRKYQDAYFSLLREFPEPEWLLGAIDVRKDPLAPEGPESVFNSVFQFHVDREVKCMGVYDKIHTVPFGEFTPFARYLPWLEKLIGMGRGLTPGTDYAIFKLPQGIPAGANICYEDAYPEISREFARKGAWLLLTITNDAWYAESAGSRQHLLHAVFRAAETRLPLLRSGNNSDSCLILPDGRITQSVVDPATGGRFYRGVGYIEVPIRQNPEPSFYTRHGDWPVWGCAFIAALALGVCGRRRFMEKQRRLAKVSPPLEAAP